MQAKHKVPQSNGRNNRPLNEPVGYATNRLLGLKVDGNAHIPGRVVFEFLPGAFSPSLGLFRRYFARIPLHSPAPSRICFWGYKGIERVNEQAGEWVVCDQRDH
eukprot:scaffold6875_cov159-Ochromonas_danica.AAC.3